MQNLELQNEIRDNLIDFIDVIGKLTKDEYTNKILLLGNATIGEHTRHIIELFEQLFTGYFLGVVDYDNRKRNLRLQEDINFASEAMANIISQLCKSDQKLKLVSNYNNLESFIDTNYYRELLFNLEHSIHHQAIIRVGLLAMNKTNFKSDFGYAKSTTIYKKQCAQ